MSQDGHNVEVLLLDNDPLATGGYCCYAGNVGYWSSVTPEPPTIAVESNAPFMAVQATLTECPVCGHWMMAYECREEEPNWLMECPVCGAAEHRWFQ